MALFLKGIIFEGRFEFVIRAKILKLLSHEWSRRWEKKQQKEINARDKKKITNIKWTHFEYYSTVYSQANAQ